MRPARLRSGIFGVYYHSRDNKWVIIVPAKKCIGTSHSLFAAERKLLKYHEEFGGAIRYMDYANGYETKSRPPDFCEIIVGRSRNKTKLRLKLLT